MLLRNVGPVGPPGWVTPGAILDMDFANARYYGGSPELLVNSRASAGFSPYAGNSGMLGTFAANIPRITDRGWVIELAATNLALRSRDFANAAWVSTNMTVAQTSVGADGTTNGAARLTAGAINATTLQTITGSSVLRVFSIYVKRITGTGTVSICQDGVTFSDRSASISTTSWTQIALTATQLNPIIGIQLGTSGDAIDVDFGQLEIGTYASTPIVTTSATATRNADVCTMLWTRQNPTFYSLLARAEPQNSAGLTYGIFGFSDGTTNNRQLVFRDGSSALGNMVSSVGGVGTSVAGPSWTNGQQKKIIGTMRSDFSCRTTNAGQAIGTASAASFPTGLSSLIFGQTGAGTSQLCGFLQRVAIIIPDVSDGIMQNLTQ